MHARLHARVCACVLVCVTGMNRYGDLNCPMSGLLIGRLGSGCRTPINLLTTRVLINGRARNGVDGNSLGRSWRIPTAQLDIYS